MGNQHSKLNFAKFLFSKQNFLQITDKQTEN